MQILGIFKLSRKSYPTFYLLGSSNSFFEALFNSLKYSTHGNFKIVSESRNFDISSSHHFDYHSPKNDKKNITHNEYSIGFFDSKFLFFSGNSCQTINRPHSEDFDLLLKASGEFIQSIKEQVTGESMTIDFMIDYNHKPIFIAAQQVCGQSVKCYDSRSSFADNFSYAFRHTLKQNNMMGRIEVFKSDANDLEFQLIFDSYGKHWVGYRALGINIPLLIIQNFLSRQFSTLKLVDELDVDIDPSYCREPKYRFKFDTIFFDFDETLICKNKPIRAVVSLIHVFKKMQKKIVLITRHPSDVSKALDKIELSVEHFEKIIYVRPDELKSEFVSSFMRPLFIDNEFPQRLDVRLKSGIPCLDVDQIQFLQVSAVSNRTVN